MTGFDDILAPYAAHASRSHGRELKEDEHSYRSPYQRDRDRIIHSTAFRRLESKTQVYTHLYQEGDHFRKRLTHTLEVAQIARTIARVLNVNEDLTEAVALAHDLGHAPFGHKGQDILNELMKDDGGFEHNTQALRIVCIIERRYPGFDGLNLTHETLESLAKRSTGKKLSQREPLKDKYDRFPNPPLEAQVVDLADPITYTAHDLDDGITAGTLTADMLKNCIFWEEGKKEVLGRYGPLPAKIEKYQIIRYLIDSQVSDLVNTTRNRIRELGIESIDDIRRSEEKICCFSPEIEEKHRNMKQFLRKEMYERTSVKRMEIKARKVITKLFNTFLENPDLLPEGVQRHFEEKKKLGEQKRIICDYIAGMTDRFALREYKDLSDPTSRV